MKKIGLVGAKNFHGMSFSELINGASEELMEKFHWGPRYKKQDNMGAAITHVWDAKQEDAEESAKVCGIGTVAERMEDMIGQVDGVIVSDDVTLKHQRRSIPFLKAGVPTFIDKPLAPVLKEAQELVTLAKKYKTPLMSCSALRFAKETEDFRAGKDNIGQILTGVVVCREWGGNLIYYGIHALEMLYSLVGSGVRSASNAGRGGEDLVSLSYRDGRRFAIIAYQKIKCSFQVSLFGTEGQKTIVVADSTYYYSQMLRTFIKMVETKVEPIPLKETLEIIKVLSEAGGVDNRKLHVS